MTKVAIIDYGMGNVGSVARAVEECGGRPTITADPGVLTSSDRLILPGVGSFRDGMEQIRRANLLSPLTELVIGQRRPFLGICLGMELLGTVGHEGGRTEGLGWIPGEIKRLVPATPATRIPHVGWNEVDSVRDNPLFEGIPNGKDFYFVHSYHFACDSRDHELANTPYCGRFTSVIAKDNIFGVQFHPEKSQRMGLTLLKNFLKY